MQALWRQQSGDARTREQANEATRLDVKAIKTVLSALKDTVLGSVPESAGDFPLSGLSNFLVSRPGEEKAFRRAPVHMQSALVCHAVQVTAGRRKADDYDALLSWHLAASNA
ncbi:hypothetical protein [Caballeronia sp. AZ1_KS37]|uniref:hypothetical protein n=1 Tax=Caballeronia sp. AZ1_KS37 TaxID=2921756 RepID=UPI0020287815|nr:hypothetical protein [Caballeronia sp. AZ1_KS37]